MKSNAANQGEIKEKSNSEGKPQQKNDTEIKSQVSNARNQGEIEDKHSDPIETQETTPEEEQFEPDTLAQEPDTITQNTPTTPSGALSEIDAKNMTSGKRTRRHATVSDP